VKAAVKKMGIKTPQRTESDRRRRNPDRAHGIHVDQRERSTVLFLSFCDGDFFGGVPRFSDGRFKFHGMVTSLR